MLCGEGCFLGLAQLLSDLCKALRRGGGASLHVGEDRLLGGGGRSDLARIVPGDGSLDHAALAADGGRGRLDCAARVVLHANAAAGGGRDDGAPADLRAGWVRSEDWLDEVFVLQVAALALLVYLVGVSVRVTLLGRTRVDARIDLRGLGALADSERMALDGSAPRARTLVSARTHLLVLACLLGRAHDGRVPLAAPGILIHGSVIVVAVALDGIATLVVARDLLDVVVRDDGAGLAEADALWSILTDHIVLARLDVAAHLALLGLLASRLLAAGRACVDDGV